MAAKPESVPAVARVHLDAAVGVLTAAMLGLGSYELRTAAKVPLAAYLLVLSVCSAR